VKGVADPIQRPRRVVMVDADNPLVEVEGEFFWAEDHRRIVDEQRNGAYRDGYAAGFDAASSRVPVVQPVAYVIRQRRGPIGWLLHSVYVGMVALVVGSVLISLLIAFVTD